MSPDSTVTTWHTTGARLPVSVVRLGSPDRSQNENPLWNRSENPSNQTRLPPGAMKSLHRLFGVATFCLAAVTAFAQVVRAPDPPAPNYFAIMAWGTSPSDPEQLGLMREVGLNVSGFCRVDDLEAVQRAGLSCFVSDWRINGYDWANLPDESEIRRNIASVAEAVRGHPAMIGFQLLDEPHASLMPALGKVAAILREMLPDAWPYVNLFPHHAGAAATGTPSYDTYVRMLVDVIRQPFLSYDHYALVNGQMMNSFYTNLEIVRRVGLETGTPFWNVILANTHFSYMDPSDATLNLQVYSTLAYGGRGIQYFTYFTPAIGNYRSAAIDWFGNKTPTWDMLRRINQQIHALAPTLVNLRSTGVYHHPVAPPEGQPLSQSKLVASIALTRNAPEPPPFLVGEFEDGRGRPYLLLVNKDLNNSYRFAIQLRRAGAGLIRISPYSGREQPLGREMDWLAPGAGVLLRVE